MRAKKSLRATPSHLPPKRISSLSVTPYKLVALSAAAKHQRLPLSSR
jgi:hypothetical protein